MTDRRKLIVIITLVSALNACAWLGNASVPAVQGTAASEPVSILNGGLLVSQSGEPELGLTLVNNSDYTLWVSVHFRTPGNRSDCLATKELDSQSNHLYICPQPAIQADVDYPVQVSVFSDLGHTQLEETMDTHFRFDQTDIRVLEHAAQP